MYSNILVPIDLSHGDVGKHILKLARHVGGPDAKITVLTVMDDIPAFVASQIPEEVVEMHHAEVRDSITSIVEAAEGKTIVSIRKGNPGSVILDEAEQIGADAIIIGSHRPDYRDYLIGSTAARVVRHAQCSVIVDRSMT